MVGEITKRTAYKTVLLLETFWSQPQHDKYEHFCHKEL